jgi:hypothetical protein
LPADLESRPAADIPLLYAAMDAYADVVCGRRIRRGDGKALASDIFAKVNRWLFNVQVHDSNWIKLIRRDRLQGIRLYTDWHRFLVALLVYRGCRVKEVETVWRRREYGRSKFGFARMPAGLAGAIQVKAYLLWRDRSMLCFAHVALVSLLVAVLAALTALVVGSHHPAWVPAWGYSIAAQAVAVITIAIGLALDFTSWQRETDRPQPVDDNRL